MFCSHLFIMKWHHFWQKLRFLSFVQRHFQKCLSSWGFCGLWCHTIITPVWTHRLLLQNRLFPFLMMLSGDSVSLKVCVWTYKTQAIGFNNLFFHWGLAFFHFSFFEIVGLFPFKKRLGELIHCVLHLTADDFWDQEIVLLSFWWPMNISIHGWIHWEHVAQMQKKKKKKRKYAKCGVQIIIFLVSWNL